MLPGTRAGEVPAVMRVLLVEDHGAMREMIAAHLRGRGFAVDPVACGEEALAATAAAAYDAVILDLGLPDMDGMEVLRRLRGGRRPDLPALILTARDGIEARVGGLDAGADDYILSRSTWPSWRRGCAPCCAAPASGASRSTPSEIFGSTPRRARARLRTPTST